MKMIELAKTGEKISILGQGTWGLKGKILFIYPRASEYYEQWKNSLRKGIELGMNHIDTAEVYGWGVAERIVGEILAEYRREDLFITTKLLPIHFGHNGSKKAAYNSLKRLGLESVDLYLIHFRNPFSSLRKQMRMLEELVDEGKTRYIGVSNFSVEQFKEAQSYLKKHELVNNQVRANVLHQGHIHESLPFYQKEGITMTAYSPLGHTGFNGLKGEIRDKLEKIAESHNTTIQQIAIAWLINHENVITIPKAFKIEHLEANAQAAGIKLRQEEINLLSAN
ncbi:MAG: aldo/keto reductase [Candidatus Hodarchaeota archaeon]